MLLFHLFTLIILSARADNNAPAAVSVKTQVNACPECQGLDPEPQAGSAKLIKEATDILKIACAKAPNSAECSCLKIRESQECRDVAAEIKSGNEKPEDYMRQCNADELQVDADSIWTGTRLAGCAMGVVDVGALDLFHTVVNIPHSIESALSDHQQTQYCNGSVNAKRDIYLKHNFDVPEDLQIPIPPDRVLKAYDCSDLENAVKEEARYRTTQKLISTGHTFSAPDTVNLLKFVKSKTNEWKIHLKCYNPARQARLVCKSALYAASSAVMGPLALKGLRLLAGLHDAKKAYNIATFYSSAAKEISEAGSVKTPPIIAREKMTNENLKANFTNKEQNVAFKKIAVGDESDGRTVYLHDETSFLGDVNQQFGKDFGTALTNIRKKFFFNEVKNFEKEYNLEEIPYSDFKSGRIRLRVKKGFELPADFDKKVAAVFDKYHKDLTKYLADNNILPANMDPPPDHLFHLGVGDTAPEAAQSAEKAKELIERGEKNHAVFYKDRWVQEGLAKNLDDSEVQFQRISARENFRESGLTEQAPFSNEFRLTDEALAYIKKGESPTDAEIEEAKIKQTFKNPDGSSASERTIIAELKKEKLRKRLNKVYGLDLRSEDVELLQDYYKNFSTFSPPLLQDERMMTTLEDAIHGQHSYDARSLGAAGRNQTAQAVHLVAASRAIDPPVEGLEALSAAAGKGGKVRNASGLKKLMKAISRDAAKGVDKIKAARRVSALNEDALTKSIKIQQRRLKQVYEQEWGKSGITYRINETGDELDFIPLNKPSTPEIDARIIKRLAARKNPASLRLTIVEARPEGGKIRQAFTDFGENLEKDVRKEVVDAKTRVEMNKVFLPIRIKDGKPILMPQNASPELEIQIQKAFKELVAKHPNPMADPAYSKTAEEDAASNEAASASEGE